MRPYFLDEREQNMTTPPIRTITLGLNDAHPLTSAVIKRAAATLAQAQKIYEDHGYEVQTVRLSTRPIFDDLAESSTMNIFKYTQRLQRMLDNAGLGFCSLGPLNATAAHYPAERIDFIVDILSATTALNAAVLIVQKTGDGNLAATLPTARAMLRLARETEGGQGNFRFAMLSRVLPGTPFFPAAYHSGPASITVGLQGAGIISEALNTTKVVDDPIGIFFIDSVVKLALEREGQRVVRIAQEIADACNIRFGGIDLSPAPMGQDSIASAIELCGYGKFGEPGTLAVAAALTNALKNVNLPTCGYCGLMLPVLEDAVLGQRWAEGLVSVEKLLLFSSVCGTGLDTVPLPGDMDEATLTNILRDVAALAARLHKPLSARLFPVPGKKRGERTAFTSPYLTNTTI
jgi:uncharacterized protein (UPF0210 family)